MSKETFTCKNCGCCCGPVPISREERNKIRVYLLKHPEIEEKAKGKPGPSVECVFRDNELGKCLIYPCRPRICKDYRCDSDNWGNETPTELRKHQREAKKYGIELINERFGNPEFKDSYQGVWKEFEQMMTVPRRKQ